MNSEPTTQIKTVTLPTDRDWTEDHEQENGKYICRCIQCNQDFIAHKRRQVCRVCAYRNSAAIQMFSQAISPPSDSPRTDKAAYYTEGHSAHYAVEADFARELERELNTALKQSEHNKRICEGLIELFTKEGWSPDCTLINQLSCMNFNAVKKAKGGGMNIRTTHVFPPIPDRSNDWMAYLDDSDGDGPQGWGKTEEEAIADLKQQIEEGQENPESRWRWAAP